MIKALIFDFDGLIMDTESPEVDAWRAIYAEYGQEFPIQVWVRDVVGATLANFDPAAHLAAISGRKLDLPALRSRAHSNRLQELSTLSPRPGVIDYIKDARRLGLRLAVASSSGHAWVEGYLRQLGLLEYFEAIRCQEDVTHLKPAPDLFLAALDALKLRPEEVLVFEDSPNGVMAARRAGMRVVAVPNSITVHGTFEGTSLVVASLADLPLDDLLKQLNPKIRHETPADIPGIRQVEEQAFGRPVEADLVDLCRTHARVSLSLVAVLDGGVAGHVLFTPVRLEQQNNNQRGLGLGPIAVLPECQRMGIGSSLIRSGVELCRAAGYDFIVLLGEPRYYSRFGFKPARDSRLSSDYGDGDEFQVLELRPGSLAGASGKVKYIPEFKEMDC